MLPNAVQNFKLLILFSTSFVDSKEYLIDNIYMLFYHKI